MRQFAAVIPVAIGLALAAAVVHGTWNVLVKVSGDPLTTFQRATVLAVLISAVPVAIAWFAIGRPSLSVAAIGFAVVSAVFELAYLWLLSAAYRRGELSVVYPIARGSAPLLAVVIGLAVLGERLTGLQLAGVGLLLRRHPRGHAAADQRASHSSCAADRRRDRRVHGRRSRRRAADRFRGFTDGCWWRCWRCW